MAEKIISKGFYTHPGVPNFVSAKHYVVIRKGKENHLFFRFENPKNETLTAISFSVDCYDSEGRITKTAKIEQNNLKAKGHSCFVVNRPVVLDDGCVDFRITINSAGYGDYRYITHGNDVEVIYEKQDNSGEIDRVPLLQKLGGHTHRSAFKTLHSPHFFAALVSLVVVALFLFLGIKLYNFTRTEKLFTLDQVEYTFATSNRESGPIIIVGTKSKAANIIVPDEIEGHDVLAVSSKAFSNSKVRTIKFEGSIEIRDNAFNGASRLQTVTIDHTKSIGNKAFYNCSNLTNIVVSSGLETVGQSAFENCRSLVNVAMPNSVKTIKDRAFTACSKLTMLTIPDTVTSIGKDITLNCTAMQSLQVPFIGPSINEPKTLKYFFNNKTPSSLGTLTVTKMESIENNMFAGESSLTTVKFLAPVTSIGNMAFNGCTKLKVFDIPATVESIGSNAFSNCSSLEAVIIPESVTVIKDNTFNGCTSLKTASLHDNLTSIGNYAFNNCLSLTVLNIPASVTYIGNSALYNCKSLTTLVLPFLGNTVSSQPRTLTTIIANGAYCQLRDFTLLSGDILPDYTFAGFANLKRVTLPDEIESIGVNCFYGCRALTDFTFPEAVTSIKSSAFYDCASLSSIEIPETVTSAGDYAFHGCSSLESITFQNDSTDIGIGIFSGCSSLTDLTLPEDLDYLTDSMCSGCSSLESVIIPAGVTAIPSYAFQNCSALKSIAFPVNLTGIGSYAFANCSALPSFEFAQSVTRIDERAFSGCKSLTSIVIPETVTNVGRCVFENCTSLESMTAPYPSDFSSGVGFKYYFSDYYAPSSLKHVNVTRVMSQSLPSGAFSGFSGLEDIILPNNLLTIGTYAFQNCYSLKNLVIPDSVTSMGSGMLSGTTALESITLPYAGTSSSTSTYGFREFYNSYGSYNIPEKLKEVTLTRATNIPSHAFYNFTSLERINLPGTLNEIGSYAFYSCTSLNELLLPASVSGISSNAFDQCIKLYEVTSLGYLNVQIKIPSAIRIFYSEAEKANSKLTYNGYTFILGNDDVWYMTDYQRGNESYALPSNFSPVIASYALAHHLFYNEYSVKAVTLPSCISDIGDYAFYNCNSLTGISIPSATKEIGSYAFYNCAALRNVSFQANSQLTCISDNAFSRTLVESITIPANVTLIDYAAFYAATSLKSVVFENNSKLDKIAGEAFRNTSLQNITLPASLTVIENYAFCDLTTLSRVNFANGSKLKSVGAYAFNNTKITEISFPSSLTLIDDYAFYNCPNLATVTLRSKPTIDNNAFGMCPALLEVYNLGGMSISAGSTGNGGLTQYAIIVHVSESAERLTDVVVDGYNFKKSDNNWFLMGLADGNNPKQIVLRNFNHGSTTVTSYVVYKSAFAGNTNITSVTIGSAVKEIMENAFYSCTSIEALSFDNNCTITSIGRSAFYDCIGIRSLTLPSSIRTIGDTAFYNCNRLNTLLLPTNLSTVGYQAFYGCYRLYDVMNTSALSVTKGSTSYGYAGYYALAVRASNVPLTSAYVTQGNVTATFAKHNTTWYLVALDTGNGTGMLTVPELVYDGSTQNYQIATYALNPVTNYVSVLIYDSVTKIDSTALSRLVGRTVYFKGSESDWSNLDKSNVISTVYTYADCIHDASSGNWRYDNSGNITTDPNVVNVTIITEPTCKTPGTKKLTCPVCQQTETAAIPVTNDHTFVDDKCAVCEKVERIIVTASNFTGCSFITNSNTPAFAFNAGGQITSQNHSHSTSTSMMITATSTMTVSFSYRVSSEQSYDYFRILLNGSEQVETSGTVSTAYTTYTVTLNAGDVLTLTYSKDYSNSSGDDCVYIKDLVMVYEVTTA